MKIHTLKTGMRVRWTEDKAHGLDDRRTARTCFRASALVVIDKGTRGTVVADGDRVVVVIDEDQRAFGEVDEVEWETDGSSTASRVALGEVGVPGMTDSCPECGNASLFDSDRKRSKWTLWCVNTQVEGGYCGATVLEADLSEDARLERRAEIGRDEPVLTEIRDIIDDFNIGDDDDGFEETANEVAFKLLALVNKHRAEAEGVA